MGTQSKMLATRRKKQRIKKKQELTVKRAKKAQAAAKK